MGLSFYTYATPLGRITLQSDEAGITRLAFGADVLEGTRVSNTVMNRCASQMQEYLAGKRQAFDVPLSIHGSDFQLSVWSEIAKIPYGEQATYSQIAERIGKPSAYRAVGSAANKNPLPILVPCHRVVGSNGALVGYAFGLKLKEFLINLERSHSQS